MSDTNPGSEPGQTEVATAEEVERLTAERDQRWPKRSKG